MKIWINKIALLSVFSVAFFACEKEEDRVILQTGTPPALSTSANNLVLTEEEADNEAITFSWTEADFGYPAAVNYTLEVDTAGDGFLEPFTDGMDNALSAAYTVAELNTLLNKIGYAAGEAHEIPFRVKASVSDEVEPVYSNTLTITATPYEKAEPVATVNTIYLVGSASAGGWDNTQATPIFKSTENENTYTYTGYLKEGQFKFLSKLGQWAPQWGSDGAGGAAYRPIEDVEDPAPFEAPAEGYYTLTIDTLALTYSQEPFDISAAEEYATIGIIGAFNEWGASVAMENTAFNPHIWEIDYTFEEDTEMKFRANDSWDVNWGAESNPDRLYGLGVQDGANLEIPAGSYTIRFNDLTGRYIFLAQ